MSRWITVTIVTLVWLFALALCAFALQTWSHQ